MSQAPMSRAAARTGQTAEGRSLGPRRLRLTPVSWVIVATTALALGLRMWQLSSPGHLTGVTEYDDGVYLGAALRLVHGVLPYRDFVLVQPPGLILIMTPVAALAKWTGTDGGDGGRPRPHRLCGRGRGAGGRPARPAPGPAGRSDHLRAARRLPGRHRGIGHGAAGTLAGAVLPGRGGRRVRRRPRDWQLEEARLGRGGVRLRRRDQGVGGHPGAGDHGAGRPASLAGGSCTWAGPRPDSSFPCCRSPSRAHGSSTGA